MEKHNGYYFGTEINEKWWKRYSAKTYFARGNGVYWHDNRGVYFLKYLTREPLFISFDNIKEVKFGKFHSGKFGNGKIVTKIIWNNNNRLSSGFIFGYKEKTDSFTNIILNNSEVTM